MQARGLKIYGMSFKSADGFAGAAYYRRTGPLAEPMNSAGFLRTHRTKPTIVGCSRKAWGVAYLSANSFSLKVRWSMR